MKYSQREVKYTYILLSVSYTMLQPEIYSHPHNTCSICPPPGRKVSLQPCCSIWLEWSTCWHFQTATHTHFFPLSFINWSRDCFRSYASYVDVWRTNHGQTSTYKESTNTFNNNNNNDDILNTLFLMNYVLDALLSVFLNTLDMLVQIPCCWYHVQWCSKYIVVVILISDVPNTLFLISCSVIF